METAQQRQQAEDRREASAARHQQAEDGRQIAEEMRETQEQMWADHGEERHNSLEQRITRIEEHLRRLDERFTQLERHLLEHIDTLHHQTQEQEAKNHQYIERAWETIEQSKQKIHDTGALIERAREQMRKLPGE